MMKNFQEFLAAYSAKESLHHVSANGYILKIWHAPNGLLAYLFTDANELPIAFGEGFTCNFPDASVKTVMVLLDGLTTEGTSALHQGWIRTVEAKHLRLAFVEGHAVPIDLAAEQLAAKKKAACEAVSRAMYHLERCAKTLAKHLPDDTKPVAGVISAMKECEAFLAANK